MFVTGFILSVICFFILIISSIVTFYSCSLNSWKLADIIRFFSPKITLTFIFCLLTGFSTIYFYKQIEIAKKTEYIKDTKVFFESGKIDSLSSTYEIYCDKKLKITKTHSYRKGMGDDKYEIVIEVLEK